MEVKDVTKAAFFAVTDNSLITVDFDDLAKKHKENVAKAATQPVRGDNQPAEELKKLRHELFTLEQRAKNTEIYANNQAGNVRLLEKNLEEAKKLRDKNAEKGNALAESNYAVAISRLTIDFVDAQNEFKRAQRNAAEATRVLKEWPHRARVKELEKIVG